MEKNIVGRTKSSKFGMCECPHLVKIVGPLLRIIHKIGGMSVIKPSVPQIISMYPGGFGSDSNDGPPIHAYL